MSGNTSTISKRPKRHKQYTQEERHNFCTKWKESGLSMTKFCKGKDIIISTLSTWVKTYNKNKHDSFRPLNIHDPLSIPSSLPPSHCVEITLATGVNIKIIRPPTVALIILIKELMSCN